MIFMRLHMSMKMIDCCNFTSYYML